MFGDLGLAARLLGDRRPACTRRTHVDDAVADGAKNAAFHRLDDAERRRAKARPGRARRANFPPRRLYREHVTAAPPCRHVGRPGDPMRCSSSRSAPTLTTGSDTTVSLIDGAQACNVFWQVGSSATLGTGAHFVGTIMAAPTITANTAATIHGRLLAQEAAVTSAQTRSPTPPVPPSGSGRYRNRRPRRNAATLSRNQTRRRASANDDDRRSSRPSGGATMRHLCTGARAGAAPPPASKSTSPRACRSRRSSRSPESRKQAASAHRARGAAAKPHSPARPALRTGGARSPADMLPAEVRRTGLRALAGRSPGGVRPPVCAGRPRLWRRRSFRARPHRRHAIAAVTPA